MDIHHIKLKEAALQLGIQVIDESGMLGMPVLKLIYKKKSQYVIRGRIFESLSYFSERIACNKYASKQWLRELGIPVAPDIAFTDAYSSENNIRIFLEQYKPVVIKPLGGSQGKGVYMGLKTWRQIEKCYHAMKAEYGGVRDYSSFLIEQEVSGHDVRVHAIDGTIVASVKRIPAHIVGDGIHDIFWLVEYKNALKIKQNQHNRINIDEESVKFLREQGMTTQSVPKKGQRVFLREIANISQGGDAVDITNDLHQGYSKWISAISKKFQLSIFAVDCIAADYTKDPKKNAVCLEVNAKPMWMHHTFSEGRQHDMATMILKSLFNIQS